MTRASSGCIAAPNGSSMISRSENSLTRNGSTDARSSGPPRLKRTMAVGSGRAVFIMSSHGAGKDRASFVRGQVGVEDHADVAGEEAAARGHRDRAGRNRQQAVRRGSAGTGQRLELRGEVVLEADAKSSSNRRPVDVEIAHQLGNDVAPHLVVAGQRVAALDREAAGVERLVVLRQR